MKKTLLLLIVIASLASCKTRNHVSGWNFSGSAPAYGGGGYSKSERSVKYADEEIPRRVVIYNAYLHLETKNADSLNNYLTRLAKQYEGYLLSLGSEKSVIRVKSIFLSDAISGITRSSKVNRKTVSGEDVTEDYHDANIRLDNCKKARQRYLELLAKAENVEAALKVEHELERLNREIDMLEGKIKRLQHLSEFSTITVNMEKKVKPGVIGYVFVGLYKGVRWLFVRG